MHGLKSSTEGTKLNLGALFAPTERFPSYCLLTTWYIERRLLLPDIFASCCKAEDTAYLGMWDAWPLIRWVLAAILATYIGVNGLKKKSLNRSGAIAVRVVFGRGASCVRQCHRDNERHALHQHDVFNVTHVLRGIFVLTFSVCIDPRLRLLPDMCIMAVNHRATDRDGSPLGVISSVHDVGPTTCLMAFPGLSTRAHR